MTHETIVADLDRDGKSNKKAYFELSGISPNTSSAYEEKKLAQSYTHLSHRKKQERVEGWVHIYRAMPLVPV